MERSEGANWSSELKELGDSSYQLAKGEPDIRGWNIFDGQGKRIGEVKELLCDAHARKVRYLVVDLEGNLLDLEPRDILVPISLAELHPSEKAVIIPQVSSRQFQALPAYHRDQLTPEMQTQVQRIFVGDYVYRPGVAQGSGLSTSETYPLDETMNKHAEGETQRAQHVIGLFTTPQEVDRRVQALSNHGFPKEQVEVAMRQSIDPQRGLSPKDFEAYFRQLFSTQAEADQNFEKFRQSNALVVVKAYHLEEANAAARLLDASRAPETEIMVEPLRQPEPNAAPDISPADQYSTASTEGRRPYQENEVEIRVTHQKPHTPLPEIPLKENRSRQEENTQPEPTQAQPPAAEFGSFQEGSIELKEFAEIPIVSKEPHVVEEINIAKKVEEREETVRDSVIRTEIDIEKIRKDPPRQAPPPPSF
ncbi:PRC-barrel domain-containing protein [Rufibacter radiotolerans]|uniref:PRC-barrel domain-containing protein n=1 Tax=Rufibacter radiotolerans TaxID=1379910 RepID=UPI000664784C|nr:PRC-barrel domain-containing protein [Rufibacter radiotolerans]